MGTTTGWAMARGQSPRSISVGLCGAGFEVWVSNVTRGSRMTRSWRVTWTAQGRSYRATFGDRERAASFAAEKLPAVLRAAGVAS